jgi:radical SAM protein with 4Fe4S-binding SPASM domain
MNHHRQVETEIAKLSETVDSLFQTFEHRGTAVPLFSQIDISLIDMCNRACVFCPRSDPAIAPNQHLAMSLDLCRSIAAQLKELKFGGVIYLAGYGEPLLHRSIMKVIEILASACQVEIYTNGDRLSADRIRALFHAGLTRLVVNLYDGPHQVEMFRGMFGEAAISRRRYVLRERWYPEAENFGMRLTNRAGTVKAGVQAPVDVNSPCNYPHYYLMVDWNGDVFICPHDWNRRTKAGNLYVSSMVNVWTSTILTKYRRLLARGCRTEEPCRSCNATGTLAGDKHRAAWVTRYSER